MTEDAVPAVDAVAPKEAERVQEKEVEQDAAPDKRPKVAATAARVDMATATLNVLPGTDGKTLMTLTDGGFQHLLAGARCTAGQKAGRYMFEVRVTESLSPQEVGQQARGPMPRQMLRIGVATQDTNVLIGDEAGSICFDAEGLILHEGKRQRQPSNRFGRGEVVAVVLNLDPTSKLANTMSLFKDGMRASEPMPLPEDMLGRPLFPTVTYRNVTIKVDFGPTSTVPMPFRCRTLGEAAADDVVVLSRAAPQGGKCEVLFPVGLPSHGFFDWVDLFVKNNPGYMEISDRKVFEWAERSGLLRGRPRGPGCTSIDKPDFASGVENLDNYSMRKVLTTLAQTNKRNYIVPELVANLVPAGRQAILQHFPAEHFKRTSCVVMGDPTEEYTGHVHGLVLAEKRAAAEAERRWAERREQRKTPISQKVPSAPASEAEENTPKNTEGTEDAVKDPEAKDGDSEMKDAAAPAVDEDAPVELTEEEKKVKFRRFPVPDVTERFLSASYAQFSMPTCMEGFDSVTYPWSNKDTCSKQLKEWVMEKKLTQRAEEIQPGEKFNAEWEAWQDVHRDLRKVQSDAKDRGRKDAAAKRRNKHDAEDDEAGEDGAEAEVDVEDVDVATVENVNDVGNGQPLFVNFVWEDWTMLQTRVELHLLVHAFKKDLNDVDRPSFNETHLAFYYNRYFRKPFEWRNFGVEAFPEFVELIQDTIVLDEKTQFLNAVNPEDCPMETFVKLTEEHRRERQQRIDAGDETAKLKLVRPQATAPPPPQYRGPPGGYGCGKGGRPFPSGPGGGPPKGGPKGGYLSGLGGGCQKGGKRQFNGPSGPSGPPGGPMKTARVGGPSSYSGAPMRR